MPFYDMEQLDAFQADIIVVPMPECQDNAAAHLVVLRPPFANRLQLALDYHKTMNVASAIADDLADATWDDAEWQ